MKRLLTLGGVLTIGSFAYGASASQTANSNLSGAFLSVAVPGLEPARLFLIGGGIVGLLLIRRLLN